MAENSAKLWFQRKLNQTAITRAGQAIENLGRALPCRVTAVNGAIVTVEFQMDTSPWTLKPITIPKAESPAGEPPALKALQSLAVEYDCDA